MNQLSTRYIFHELLVSHEEYKVAMFQRLFFVSSEECFSLMKTYRLYQTVVMSWNVDIQSKILLQIIYVAGPKRP